MYLCLVCNSRIEKDDPRITDRTHPNYGNCPECGVPDVLPTDLDDTVSVSLTWRELRTLVIWSERWAAACHKTDPVLLKILYTIADRLQLQHMERDGLTLRSELAELSAAGYTYQQDMLPDE